MMHIELTLMGLLAAQVRTTAQRAGLQCQDLQPESCITFHDARPDLCGDTSFSETMCKRYCGNCPLECYSCSNTVLNPQDCNTTSTCSPDEQCVTRTLKTKDGRIEYWFGCELSELCGLLAGSFGKRTLEDIEESDDSDGARYERDVLMRCCTGDLCNVKALTTTSTPTTTSIPTTTVHTQPQTTTHRRTTHTTTTTRKPTTTHRQTTHNEMTHTQTTHRRTHSPTTTPNPTHASPSHVSCTKDIAFIMETKYIHTSTPNLVGRGANDRSGRATSHTSSYRTALPWIPFIQQILSRITIGIDYSHVAVVTFGHKTHIQWHLNTHWTQTGLQQALTHLGKLHIPTTGPTENPAIALNRTAHEVFLYGGHGDRRGAKNVVVVLEKGAFNHKVPHLHSAITTIHGRSHKVIQVSVDSGATTGHVAIANSNQHMLHATTFDQLPHLVSKIVPLICA